MSRCASCGLPGHRYGRNEGPERYDPMACINMLRGENERLATRNEMVRQAVIYSARPGDKVVLEVEHLTTMEQIGRLKEDAEALFGLDVAVVIIGGGAHFVGVLRDDYEPTEPSDTGHSPSSSTSEDSRPNADSVATREED